MGWLLEGLGVGTGLGLEVCSLGDFWSLAAAAAPLSNRSAQGNASACVTSLGHTMGHCKVKCSLCSVQQAKLAGCWRGLGAWAGGLQFGQFLEFDTGNGAAREYQRTDPCQCVFDQPWACHGSLQGQM